MSERTHGHRGTGATRRQPRWWVLALVALCATEVSLRAAGIGYRALREATDPPASSGEADLTVLCLGDSFTFGWGVPFANSYPRVLERILLAQRPGQRVRVLNAGIPAFSSSQVRRRFEMYLLHAHPQVVVVLAGANDSWNFTDSEALIPAAGLQPRRAERAVRALDQSLSQLRLYRFIKYAIVLWSAPAAASPVAPAMRDPSSALFVERGAEQLREVLQGGATASADASHSDLALQALAYQDFEGLVGSIYGQAESGEPADPGRRLAQAWVFKTRWEFDKAFELYRALIEEEPQRASYHCALGHLYVQHGLWVEGAYEFLAAIRLEPDAAGAYADLGNTLQLLRAHRAAQECLLQAIRRDASKLWYWAELGRTSEQANDLVSARQAWVEVFRRTGDLTALAGIQRTCADAAEALAVFRRLQQDTSLQGLRHRVDDWMVQQHLLKQAGAEDPPSRLQRLSMRLLAENLDRMADEAAARDVRFVLATYPTAAHHPALADANAVARQVAAGRTGVWLADVQPAFEAVSREHERNLQCAFTWHPNAAGYEVMAGHLASVIEQAQGR